VSTQQISSGVSDRYATALFELAVNEGGMERVAVELTELAGLIDESADLRRLLASPVFSSEDQASAMAAVLARAGVSGLTAKFVGVVAGNRRLFALRSMIDAYQRLRADRRGEMEADIVSAHGLSDGQISSLKDALKGATGRDVQVNLKVDQALLGGLVVKIGSRMIDSSLRTKLNGLKIAMKEAG